MDEDKKLNSFNINTNNDIITYNTRGMEKLSQEDKIILSTNDPFGNSVVLWESTFLYHIIGEHNNDSRHYLNNDNNFQRIEYTINRPIFILEDKTNKNRWEFISLTDIEDKDETRLKSLSVITEESDSVMNSLEVVTVIPKSNVSQNITNRRVVYNVNNNNDRI